MPVGKW